MIKLNTINNMTRELACSLVGKHIHFTYHNREDNTIEIMPGKVLEVNDNTIKIDTMDIIMTDREGIVKEFSIDDITDIIPFEEDDINTNVLEMAELVEESDLNKTLFDIVLFRKIVITTTISEIDIPLSLTINDNGEMVELPLYFISEIKKR